MVGRLRGFTGLALDVSRQINKIKQTVPWSNANPVVNISDIVWSDPGICKQDYESVQSVPVLLQFYT